AGGAVPRAHGGVRDRGAERASGRPAGLVRIRPPHRRRGGRDDVPAAGGAELRVLLSDLHRAGHPLRGVAGAAVAGQPLVLTRRSWRCGGWDVVTCRRSPPPVLQDRHGWACDTPGVRTTG